MNQYKIDWNKHAADVYPYALYSKRGWWGKWEFIASHKTKDGATELYRKLIGLPIYLDEDA